MFNSIRKIIYKEKSNERRTKKSYLLGLFYFKQNKITLTCEYGILFLPILRKRYNFGVVNYYFFNIRIFSKSPKKELYRQILKILGDKYKNIFINYSCSGETFLFWKSIEIPENSIIINTKHYHKTLCDLVHPNTNCIYLTNLWNMCPYSGYLDRYKGHNFYNVLPFSHFVNLEKQLQKGQEIHYYDVIMNAITEMGLNVTTKEPIVSEETKESVLKKVKKIGLDINKFIFLCPESQSNESIEDNLWDNIIEQLNKKGYDVFSNIMIQRPEYGIAKTCFLTLEEAFYLASWSKGVIGLRSGIFELLANIKNIPIVSVYTKFVQRGKLKEMASEKVLTGFTLTKLPNVNVNNLFEYDINKISERDLLLDFEKLESKERM